MPTSSQNPQAMYLLWAVAVIFCSQRPQEALHQIQAGVIQVNGQVILEPLHSVGVGDTLVLHQDHCPIDLHVFRKGQALCHQLEGYYGGPVATYQRLGVSKPPATEE
jgi:hypothetical protein